MKNRLEDLRQELDKLIMSNEPHNICRYSSHMFGVAKFCTLLAIKRNLNIELATTCGMLHDIYYMTGGSSDDHAAKGAQQAKTILKEMMIYSDDEIRIITTAISQHSDKKAIHSVYDELLKDADVMDHCLYNNDFPVAEWEVDRYNHLFVELGLNTSKCA